MLLQLLLSSDEAAFGGFENLSKKYDTEYASKAGDYDGRPNSIQVLVCTLQLSLTHVPGCRFLRPLVFTPLEVIQMQLEAHIVNTSIAGTPVDLQMASSSAACLHLLCEFCYCPV